MKQLKRFLMKQMKMKRNDTDSTSETGAAVAASDEVAEEQESTREAELEQKLQEAEAKYVRLYADFDNYRRRVKLGC